MKSDFLYFTQIECKPINPEGLRFPEEENVYWYPVAEHNNLPENYHDMKIFGLMDLADKQKAANCNTAIVVVGVDSKGHVWSLEALRRKSSPSETMNNMFKFADKYNLPGFHVEEMVLDSWFKRALKEQCQNSPDEPQNLSPETQEPGQGLSHSRPPAPPCQRRPAYQETAQGPGSGTTGLSLYPSQGPGRRPGLYNGYNSYPLCPVGGQARP